MAVPLLIESLPAGLSSSNLKQLFEPFGIVVWARVPTDHRGTSSGYGYVEMMCEEEAHKALKALDGFEIKNCRLQVTTLSVSPLIAEGHRFLESNHGKAFCDICLLSHVEPPPVISISHALGMLIRHFQTTSHGTCFDCDRQTQVISARTVKHADCLTSK
jgi:hypothetical protein